jgi:hypothetical protein
MDGHGVEARHLLVGMNDVEALSHGLSAEIGEEELIHPGRLGDPTGDPVKRDGLISLEGPFVGENMNLVMEGEAARHFQGISLGAARRKKALDQNRNSEFTGLRHRCGFHKRCALIEGNILLRSNEFMWNVRRA